MTDFSGMTPDEVAIQVGEATNAASRIKWTLERFGDELKALWPRQRELYRRLVGLPMLDDMEAAMLYCLVRSNEPDVVVEISCGCGWSSSWILAAIEKNGRGKLHSYDIVDTAVRNLPASPAWEFHCGDAMKMDIPDRIDFYLQDSDHTLPFARNLMDLVFPRVRAGGVIAVHDVYGLRTPAHGEAVEVFKKLHNNGVSYWTVAYCYPEPNAAARSAMNSLGLRHIHPNTTNTMLFSNAPWSGWQC